MPTSGGDHRRLIPWLAEACKGARELAGVTQPEVAHLAGIERSGVARFEEGKRYPRDIDRMVKAYATATNRDDSRALWRIALGLWESYGEDAQLPDDVTRPRDLAASLDDYLEQKLGGGPEDQPGLDGLGAKADGRAGC